MKLEFYVHGSVHRESNLITVQQDTTVFSLLHFCRQLYMFRVLTPIIRSWYSCNYSFWHWSTAMNKILFIILYIIFVKASNIQYNESRILNYMLELAATYFIHCS